MLIKELSKVGKLTPGFFCSAAQLSSHPNNILRHSVAGVPQEGSPKVDPRIIGAGGGPKSKVGD